MNNPYNDIINLPPYVTKHPHMSLYDRAAQFAPFAALTGFGALINETARLTDSKPELDEETARILNERLKIIEKNIKLKPEITATYFVPDKKKSGGSLKKYSGKIRRIDEFARELVFTDKSVLSIDEILFIDGDLFKNIAREQAV